ncbi:hypothetical protein F4825DRAFT_472293 [Nemania diffusa]|nr:hypothetical protein F4825DRAFT_472293 [Nemania diffusa]
MASEGEKALTCKVPSRKDKPFLRFNLPDWSKIDIIGQTIILAELTPHFGSFQNTCTALSLQSNEVESFLETHLNYQRASEQGSLTADQWGRDHVVPSDGEDIPQQRPILISASSIEPACEFLRFLGYQDQVQAVQAWVQRTIVWPPHIDVTGLDMTGLDQSDITFPTPREQKRYSRYTSSLGNDARAVVALAGAWQPKDGAPDARIAFIDVPEGAMVYGPSGGRVLGDGGRYNVCWPTNSLSDNTYNDFVLARNTVDQRPDSIDIDNLNKMQCYDGSDRSIVYHPDIERYRGGLRDTTINPKGVFGMSMPDKHSIPNQGPFHKQDEPQGPLGGSEDPELQKMWDTWYGQIFQFRLPHGYSILGPQGNILTFDHQKWERYDVFGNAHGVGGTYFIVSTPSRNRPMTFKMSELPPDVYLRFKLTQPLVFIRNGMVLPRFVEPGVHEISVREGHLDLYNARGCYNILQTESSYNILPDVIQSSSPEEVPQDHEHNDEHEEHWVNMEDYDDGEPSEKGKMAQTQQLDMNEALALWFQRQEAEQLVLQQGKETRAQLDARNAEMKIAREKTAAEKRTAEERARMERVIREDVTIARSTHARRTSNPRPRAIQQQQQFVDSAIVIDSDDTEENNTQRKRGRKRLDSAELEYKPKRPRTKNPKSTQAKCASKKLQAKPRTLLALAPQSSPAQGRKPKLQMENHGPGPAPTGVRQPSAASTGPSPPRTALVRKPIGPLLDAIRANHNDEGGSGTALQQPGISQVNGQEVGGHTIDVNNNNALLVTTTTSLGPLGYGMDVD